MPDCHQCQQDASVNSRTDECGICFLTDAVFCASCAMWELGPNETDTDIFTDLATSSEPVQLNVQRQHSEESESSASSSAALPLECAAFFAALGDACPYIAGQLDTSEAGPGPFGDAEPERTNEPAEWLEWQRNCTLHADSASPAKLYDQSFKDYTCHVLDNFRQLYPTCKYDRVAMQVLLIMYLSARERVQDRWVADAKPDTYRSDVKYLKRWQIRPIAVAHLENHLDDIGNELGGSVKDLLSKKTWRDALTLDDLELFLKGCKPATVFAIDLVDLAGSAGDARETLEIAIILYHALSTGRDKGALAEHWTQKTTSFTLPDGLGCLSKAHYEALYGDSGDGSSFSAETKKQLNELWQALGDAAPTNTLPAHPRFADLNVPTTLQPVEQNYLQYLPTFDHPQDVSALRSECERVVRARVVTGVEAYYNAYLEDAKMTRRDVFFHQNDVNPTKHTTSRTIKIEVADMDVVEIKFVKESGADHISTPLTDAQERALQGLVAEIDTPAYLRLHPVVTFKVTYERGNIRRTDRRDNIINKIKEGLESKGAGKYWLTFSNDDAYVGHDGQVIDWSEHVEPFVDDLLTAMQDSLYVDQCFDDVLARLMLNNGGITPQAWFPLKLRAKPYKEIFPDCGFDDSSVYSVQDHYEPIIGTSERPAHYMDWRNHKDLWLYDGFHIDPRRRPLFCSLSVQPIVPEPNSNYGGHTMLFERSTTKHRSVHTFGDKQQPRRSMLLILDDLLYEREKKDGSEGQSAANRTKPLDDLFRRLENVTAFRASTLQEQWDETLRQAPISYPDGDLLIECQIFGPIVPANDMLGFVTWVETAAWMNLNDPNHKWYYTKVTKAGEKQDHLTTHYGGTLLHYAPSKHHSQYAPGKRPKADQLHPEDRESVIDKKASDNATRP